MPWTSGQALQAIPTLLTFVMLGKTASTSVTRPSRAMRLRLGMALAAR